MSTANLKSDIERRGSAPRFAPRRSSSRELSTLKLPQQKASQESLRRRKSPTSRTPPKGNVQPHRGPSATGSIDNQDSLGTVLSNVPLKAVEEGPRKKKKKKKANGEKLQKQKPSGRVISRQVSFVFTKVMESKSDTNLSKSREKNELVADSSLNAPSSHLWSFSAHEELCQRCRLSHKDPITFFERSRFHNSLKMENEESEKEKQQFDLRMFLGRKIYPEERYQNYLDNALPGKERPRTFPFEGGLENLIRQEFRFDGAMREKIDSIRRSMLVSSRVMMEEQPEEMLIDADPYLEEILDMAKDRFAAGRP